MGRSVGNPTVRVLILGAAGVGKNCLESRFTTTTYPPPYDPALTLNSRRFYTLTPRPPTPLASITRPLETSHGLQPLEETPSSSSFLSKDKEDEAGIGGSSSSDKRPRSSSSSSLCSNLASARNDPELLRELKAQLDAEPASAHGELPSVCLDCVRANNTFMIELINYPLLQLAKERAQIFARGEYDAVLLVYDVANQGSFQAAAKLHAEIPTRQHHLIGHPHGTNASGGGAGSSFKRRSMSSLRSGSGGGGSGKSGSSHGYLGSSHHHPNTVVALVGNKSDFDLEYASVDLCDGGLLEKVAEMEEAESGDRGLVHPMFHESRFYDEEHPMSPCTRIMMGGNRLPQANSAAAAAKRDEAKDAKHAKDGNNNGGGTMTTNGGSGVNMATNGSTTTASSEAQRLSVASCEIFGAVDEETAPSQQQQRSQSVLSHRRSNRTLLDRGDSERQARKLRKSPPKSEAVEKWIETSRPVAVEEEEAEGQARSRSALDNILTEGDGERTNVGEDDTQSTESTAESKRQVSRLEGMTLSQRLQLPIPFFETSAKTGENVEEVFEAVIRAVLKEKGVNIDERNAQAKECKRKDHQAARDRESSGGGSNNTNHGSRSTKRREIARLETQLPTIRSLLTPEATPLSAIDSVFSAQFDDIMASSPLSPVDWTRPPLEEGPLVGSGVERSEKLRVERKGKDEGKKTMEVHVGMSSRRETPVPAATRRDEPGSTMKPQPPKLQVQTQLQPQPSQMLRPKRESVLRRVKSLFLIRRPEPVGAASVGA